MQPKEWQEENLNDIDDYFEHQKKKNSKQAKRKWQEIEAFKEKKSMQREMVSYDDYRIPIPLSYCSLVLVKIAQCCVALTPNSQLLLNRAPYLELFFLRTTRSQT
ncbi:DUF3545 family protein [Colwellia sp. C1TZA3]|uniref:DUF3545 family protein n=1 Tax=Colwellia sp. C1TZA3 TaxID=2508879 RepID=UPI001CB8EAB0|nr:DUF3545 family protein [Colwellia sp. C1TZA3]